MMRPAMSKKQPLIAPVYLYGHTGTAKHQSGAVLAISLIILLLLTLIGITATQVTGLEEKMAGNFRDRNLAFQAAETALRAGEAEIEKSSLSCPIAAQVGGFYPSFDTPQIDDQFGNVWSTPGKYSYVGVILAGTTGTAQPKYIIQCLPSPPNIATGPFYFRITARGTGGSTDAVVILQSIYMQP